MLLHPHATAGQIRVPLPDLPGRPEEVELRRIAKKRVEADALRKKRDSLISDFFKLGVAISDRGWFKDSKKRLSKLDAELEAIDRKIQEIGQ